MEPNFDHRLYTRFPRKMVEWRREREAGQEGSPKAEEGVRLGDGWNHRKRAPHDGGFQIVPPSFLLDTNIRANTTNVVGGSYFVRRVIRTLLVESFSGIPRKIYSDV